MGLDSVTDSDYCKAVYKSETAASLPEGSAATAKATIDEEGVFGKVRTTDLVAAKNFCQELASRIGIRGEELLTLPRNDGYKACKFYVTY